MYSTDQIKTTPLRTLTQLKWFFFLLRIKNNQNTKLEYLCVHAIVYLYPRKKH